MNFAQRIQALGSDAERAEFCKRWYQDCALTYFQGQDESIARQIELFEINHRGRRPRGSDLTICKIVGKSRWSSTQAAKEILSDQRWFESMANMYAAQALLQRS
jgi:hypothetical protein